MACGFVRSFLSAAAIALLAAGPTLAQSSTTTYTYDALGRVTQAIQSPSGKKVVYAYDNAGNRTQVGNGVTYAEVIPTAMSASTTQSGATGLSPLTSMRDGIFNTRASIEVTQSESSPWINADFGASKNVDHIDVAAATDTPWGVGEWNVNSAIVEYSANGTTWSTAATVTGVVPGAYTTIHLGGVAGRYFRLRRPTTGQLAVGDLRFYSSDDTSNLAPTANPDTAVSNAGAAVVVNVLANDTDPENNPLTVSAFTQGAHGTVTTSGSNLSYAPTGGYTGTDAFTYTISDGHGATATGNVSVTVNAAANNPPVANDDNVTAPAFMRTTFDPRVNDTDPDGNPKTITGVGAPSHGTAVVNNGTSITYNPSTSYTGTDTFIYSISDGKGGTASANINVTITPGNPAMLAVMQPATYASQVTISGNRIETNNGSADVYVNIPMTTGRYYWEVKVLCGNVPAGVADNISTGRSSGGYDTYWGGVNPWIWKGWPGGATTAAWGAPAVGDVYGFAYNADTKVLRLYKNNVPGNIIQPLIYGTTGVYANVGAQPGLTMTGQSCAGTPTAALVQFGPGGTTYAPPTGYKHLSDHASNQQFPPVAANDAALTTFNAAKTIDPRANDIDVNGDPITVTATSTPSHGTATYTGSSVTYTPTTGYSGADSFTYTISDGNGGTATATVNMTVLSTTWSFYQPTVRVMKAAMGTTTIGSSSFDVPQLIWSGAPSALMSEPLTPSFEYEITAVEATSTSAFLGVASQAWFDAGGAYNTTTAGEADWYVSNSWNYGESSGATSSWANATQAISAGDVIGFTYSASTRKLRVYRNGSLIGTVTAASSLAGVTMYPMLGSWNARVAGSYRATPSTYASSYVFD